MGEIIEDFDKENEHKDDKNTFSAQIGISSEIVEKTEKTKLTEICNKGDRVLRRLIKIRKKQKLITKIKKILKSIYKLNFCLS